MLQLLLRYRYGSKMHQKGVSGNCFDYKHITLYNCTGLLLGSSKTEAESVEYRNYPESHSGPCCVHIRMRIITSNILFHVSAATVVSGVQI